MSVAFRRESDEEHKEPRFELPIPQGANLVTKAGLALIGTRMATFEAALAAATDEAATDEAAIADAKRSLRYWQTRRITALLTRAPADGSAGFGTRVTYTLAGRTRTITIVGDDEADPAIGAIAWSAPLPRAMAGAAAGEELAFNAGTILIVSVEPID